MDAEDLGLTLARPVSYPWDDEPWFPGKDERDDEADDIPPEWWKEDWR
jgi:hypothetical protein